MLRFFRQIRQRLLKNRVRTHSPIAGYSFNYNGLPISKENWHLSTYTSNTIGSRSDILNHIIKVLDALFNIWNDTFENFQNLKKINTTDCSLIAFMKLSLGVKGSLTKFLFRNLKRYHIILDAINKMP